MRKEELQLLAREVQLVLERIQDLIERETSAPSDPEPEPEPGEIPPVLSDKDLAALIGVSLGHVQRQRRRDVAGGGNYVPRYRLVGRKPRYSREDVLSFFRRNQDN